MKPGEGGPFNTYLRKEGFEITHIDTREGGGRGV